jgi:methyl-accepting chemotaxis protein
MPHDLSSPEAGTLRSAVVLPRDRSPLTEFFRYHGVWAPGIRLFRQLDFRAKALLISAAFAVPIGVLAWSYYTDKAAAIEFSSKERVGIVYGRELMPLLDLLQRQRSALATDDSAFEVEALAAAVRTQGARLDAAEKAHGAALATATAHGRVAGGLKDLPTSAAGPDRGFAATSAQAQAVLDLLGQSTDGSNLTLDPDIDSYYLMDAAYFRLPQMIESLGQLQALGASALQHRQTRLEPAVLRRVIEQSASVAGNLAALEAGLAKAQAYNPALKAGVDAGPATAQVRAFLGAVEKHLLGDGGPSGDAAAHRAAGRAAIEALLALDRQATDGLDRLVAARVDGMVSARNLTTGILAVALLLVTYLFISFRKVLHGGLREVAFHIDAMRDGDLRTQPRAWGADEAAGLMNTLVEMQTSLRRVVAQVRGASDNLVHSSGEIAAGSQDLSSRTEQAAASLQQSASAMEQISATVKHTSGAANEAADLARANAGAAVRGGQIIGSMVSTMDEIQQSSRRIGDIVGTIDGIAFQTNILALNAAVEAARAGAAGSGFAVVASEVRQLAQRSATAAREIKQLIGSSVDKVRAGTEVVRQAGAAIDEIVGSAQRVDALLTDIARGAHEQARGVAQTSQAVADMDAATQQNSALVEQTAAAAASLKDQAKALASEVSVFKLG